MQVYKASGIPINSIKDRNLILPGFSGYSACPIKRLYLQPNLDERNIEIARELKAIGDKESFDVAIQVNDKVYNNPDQVNLKELGKIAPWSQDNKVILGTKNGIEIADSGLVKKTIEKLVPQLSKALNIKYKKMNSVLEGGNYFIGKKNNGEYYALVGKSDLKDTAFKIACEKNGIKLRYYSEFLDIKNSSCQNESTNPKVKSAITDFNQNKDKYIEKAKTAIAKDLNVKAENIYCLSQPDYHLDTRIRPLKYPYVLVNDYNLSIETLNKFACNNSENRIDGVIKETVINYKSGEKIYEEQEKVIKELENLGFKPIRVPGCFDDATNFINAVVHQRPDGKLIYITNKSKHNYGEFDLNKAFEKVLKEKVPQIEKVYFVSGADNYDGDSYISKILENDSAGIHCLVAEHPDFDRWV